VASDAAEIVAMIQLRSLGEMGMGVRFRSLGLGRPAHRFMAEKLKTDTRRSDNHSVIEPEKQGGLRPAGTMPSRSDAANPLRVGGDNRRGLNG
jgi:hypothetical protein